MQEHTVCLYGYFRSDLILLISLSRENKLIYSMSCSDSYVNCDSKIFKAIA